MTVVAYLDPGAGSLIASVAAGGIAGVAVVAKSKWHGVKGRLKGKKVEAEPESEIDPSEAG
jgi:hypothetical protein